MLKDKLLVTQVDSNQQQEFIILFSYEFTSNDCIEMIVTNGFDKLFKVPFSFEYVQFHRLKLGITGSWQAYFELLCDAIKNDK